MRSGSLLVVLLTSTAIACGGYDEGNPLRTRAVRTESVDPTAPEDGVDDDLEGEAPPVATAPDAQPVAPAPSGGEDAGPSPALGVFDGAPAYAAKLGPTTRKASHSFAGNTPMTNPAGRPCMTCHGTAGPAPRFAIAGTIFANAGGTPAPRVEVRVIDANNQVVTAHTDADGNFFVRQAASGPLAFPLKVGARDAAAVRPMAAPATAGNCNNCHRTGGTTSPLTVP